MNLLQIPVHLGQMLSCIRSVIILSSYLSFKTSSATMMRAAHISEFGSADHLSVAEKPRPNLRANEILIKVYASAINRADILQRLGRYPPPKGESEILGLEATGVVEELGPQSSRWKVGQHVMALLAGGGNAEYVACHEDLAMPIPEGFSFIEAAAIPEVWLTAYKILHTVGRAAVGETVLVHAGGSGVGTAVVQLCNLIPATCIVTAGSQDKIDYAKSLGAAHGFNYKEGSFSQKVLEVTDGKGVNVILDCVGSSFWQDNLDSIAMDGRWVSYGLLSGGQVSGDILSRILAKRVTLQGTTLRTRPIQFKKTLVEEFTQKVLPEFSAKRLKPIINSTFPFEQISAAHKLMESNKTTGKIILKVVDESNKVHSEL